MSIRMIGDELEPMREQERSENGTKKGAGGKQQPYDNEGKYSNSSTKVNKVLYHQTVASSLNDFSDSYKKAGISDVDVPSGIFLKETDEDIGLKGKNQLKLRVRIDNALIVKDREALTKIVSENAEIKELQNKARNFDDWLASEIDARSIRAETDEDFEEIEKFIEKQNAIEKEQGREIQEHIKVFLKEKGYDGVIIENDEGSLGRKVKSFIVFDKSQLREV